MSTQTILDKEGQLNWNFIKCMDLRYPVAEDFQRIHVYKGGSVVVSGAFEVVTLIDHLELTLPEGRPISKEGAAVDALRAAGYLVEVQPDNEAFKDARNAYNAENARREADFKRILFEREGLTDNPKVEMCYSKAYEAGHASGPESIASIFIDLAELIR